MCMTWTQKNDQRCVGTKKITFLIVYHPGLLGRWMSHVNLGETLLATRDAIIKVVEGNMILKMQP